MTSRRLQQGFYDSGCENGKRAHFYYKKEGRFLCWWSPKKAGATLSPNQQMVEGGCDCKMCWKIIRQMKELRPADPVAELRRFLEKGLKAQKAVKEILEHE
jgi:hypothetical protein